MSENSAEILDTVRKIHDLLELLAEDKIDQRDSKKRASLCAIVGSSKLKQGATLLMNGTRTQKDIVAAVSVDHGDLSKLVGKLFEAKLLIGDKKLPQLAISIPPNFFETYAKPK